MNLDISISLYKKLYLLRRCELAIQKYYHENDMKTPMHMSMGSEAIAVGVCHALSDEDYVLGTYRSHALYLAKTQNVTAFFAELYGKKTGCSKGKSGSMHLCDSAKGHMGSSAVVGSHISVGVGCAFSHKYLHKNNISAVFFGDAATDEGTFWESLNLACLMKLPVLFICENNGVAVFTKNQDRRGYNSIDTIVADYDCYTDKSKAIDVEVVFSVASKAIKHIKNNSQPCFLHFEYHRYLEHVGITQETYYGNRTKEEHDQWIQEDPIKTQRIRLIENGCTEEFITIIDKEIDNLVEDGVIYARNDDFSDKEEVLRDVFCENT